MCKVYGPISSIIRQILIGTTQSDNVVSRGGGGGGEKAGVQTRYTKQPKSVKLKDSIFLKTAVVWKTSFTLISL